MKPDRGSFEQVKRQLLGEDLPKLPSEGPEGALVAIAEWDAHWRAIAENDAPKKYAFTPILKEFIVRTNKLAHWCESLGLDSSPLVQFAAEARQTCFALRPTLPALPKEVRYLLERLKFKLQPVEPASTLPKSAPAAEDGCSSSSTTVTHDASDRPVVDTDQFKLRWQGTGFPFKNSKPFRVLDVLARRYMQWVSVQQLVDEVWGDSQVEHETVQRTVSNLRSAMAKAGVKGLEIDGSMQGHYMLKMSS